MDDTSSTAGTIKKETIRTIIGWGLPPLLGLIAGTVPPIREALFGKSMIMIPLWIALGFILIAVCGLLIWFRIGKRRKGEPLSMAQEEDYATAMNKEEHDRLVKQAANDAQTHRQNNAYIAMLEGRLKEKNITLPRRPPEPPAAIMPNYPR